MLTKNAQILNEPKASVDARHLPSALQTAGWLLFSAILCIHFSLTYNAAPEGLDLAQYTQGLARTPFQYRVFPMFVFRLFVHRHFIAVLARYTSATFRDPHQVVQLGFDFVCMLIAVVATAGTIARLTGNLRFGRWFSLVLVYMTYFNLAPGWGLTLTKPYDVSSLMFFCICLYLIVADRLWLYYLVFPLAVLNRETILFVTLFFVLWHLRKIQEASGKISGKSATPVLLHAVAQVIILVGIKTWLAHVYAGNPVDAGGSADGLFNLELPYNLRELVKPQQWPIYLSCCGFLLPALWFQRRWIQYPAISLACAVIFPLWLLGMMFVGVIPEIRIFSELSAFATPALALIVYHRFRDVAANEVCG